MKAAIDSEYENGRQTVMSNEELVSIARTSDIEGIIPSED
ncbi:hypothetical protein SDC9_166539 [bioreactor metagenome]|uniref:Uncharacterized protein n=1 Tax=bioreactor metagenome TaxID=1076179 RepID=A0A645G584_9ZZZZ